METDSAQEQDAGSSSQASGADFSEVTRGAWMGSSVSQYEIDWLYRSRRIPEGVTCRLPGDEIEPVLEPGERVVFLAHFERGFGLPVSSFFRDFLDFYKLQPHHLPGNAIFYLSCYVTFMEAYIGIRPTRETFARFFALRINSVQGLDIPKPKPPVQCGSCIIGSRQASPFFKFSGLESCRSWQGTFFYVRNNGAADLIDLPPFDPAPPTKTNWSYNPKESHNETNRIIRFMKQRMKDTNICSDDIIRTFISRRVLPLKRRAHKMCEMYGPGDPTKITGLPLSKKDVVLKARQICQTSMPEDWEWGLRPLSSTNPPTQEAKDRFPGIESDKRGRCRKRGLDKFDPDPVIFWRDLKMGRTPAARLGKAPPEPSDMPSANLNPQVHEHVAPLQAEAGQEFVDKLMAQGQKNKTPASDAGSSQAPPAKRFRTEPVAGLCRLGQDLDSSSSLQPGTIWCRQHLCLPSGGHNKFGARGPYTARSPRGGGLPPLQRPTGASNMGAGKEPAGRAEPSVPPVPEKKKRKKTSSKTAPKASAPETLAPPPPPETSAPEVTGPTPTPPSTQGAPATAPKPPPASLKITDYLKPGASRGKAADGSASSGSQPLVLHAGPAAMVVQDKPSGLLGRIVELKRGGQDLGPLLPYAQRWNDADISAATRGLGKDRLPAPDPAGPRSTEEHFSRLKRAVKEFDSAWYDATANVVSTADARKALFEELLWEHRSLAEAHSQCQAIPEASIEALKAQIATLQAEKKQLIRDHQKALEAQKEISRELKDQAIQAGVRHAEELKAAEAAAEARLNEALEDAGNANVVLQAELEEGAKALKAAEGKAAKAHKAAAEEAKKAQKAAEGEVARLKAEQKEYDLLVTRTDALALRLFPDSQAHAIKKVAEHRAQQAGNNLGAPWDPYDHLVALNARVSHMRSVDRNLSDIPEVPAGGSGSGSALLPVPERTQRSALPAPGIRSWIWTLSSACTDVDPVLTAKRQDRAYHIAEYAEMRTFIPPPEDVKDYLSEEEEDEGEDVPPPTPDAGAAPPEAPAA
ncbi:hypothetical protein QYE76_068699 [Lolium multiflorum]|uniref:Transposase (putative) gypsy type domain-containing protein n=1 Tax=Lolium multiflorum TaxID=4521 RepID=A0AAD8SFB4_LOLMU|nr:hypothetical protein QYE76_068699 [Lolium multiflorum]